MNATSPKIFPDYSSYVGRKYEETNCWELVREFYSKEFGVELSQYHDGATTLSRPQVAALVASNKGAFKEAAFPAPGNIVTISLYGVECHIGVCLGHGKFLHSIRGVGSCVEKLSKYRSLITGYYCHEAAL